jgi:heme-degrading monooxygenase HmoA
MMPRFEEAPPPPYFAAIFTSQRRETVDEKYSATAGRSLVACFKQPGCLGAEFAESPDGFGIAVACFVDEGSIRAWREDAAHVDTQDLGKTTWYSRYDVRITKPAKPPPMAGRKQEVLQLRE